MFLPIKEACVGLLVSLCTPTSVLSIVEASIEDLQSALSQGHINAVQLTAKHLHRVAHYDRRGPRLNAIPIINPDVFELAQSSDNFRAINGCVRSELDGLPVTLKDSYMVKGLTVASGSPAFQNLTATSDAFTTGLLRQGGPVILGKTNMPPLANGGMQRGMYGRAESPYNKDFLTAAFASRSSNGAGSSTSSSIAMAEETVSSGRSPASNNGLVSYMPSRGVLSIRGNWPLFPGADVVVPYTRTVLDLLTLLDVIVKDDADTTADFWRGQPFVKLPLPSEIRPEGSYKSLANIGSLEGLRIGVPKMYIGEDDPAAVPIWVSPDVIALEKEARAVLESGGAVVVEVDFPLVTEAEDPSEAEWETMYPLPGPGESAPSRGPREVGAFAMDDFLAMVNDTAVSGITTLAQVDGADIFPQLSGTLPDRYGNRFGNRTASHLGLVETARNRNGTGIYELPGLEEALQGAEEFRKQHMEDWMSELGLDAVVFPAAGDVGRAKAETNEEAAEHAWRNGVFFSNGNYAIRQYGVPTVTVTMGLLAEIGMPMGLTFASRAYDDNALLSYAYAFEQAQAATSGGGRVAPPETAELPTDHIKVCGGRSLIGTVAPSLAAAAQRLCGDVVEISGAVDSTLVAGNGPVTVEVFVDGVQVAPVPVDSNGNWNVLCRATPYDDVPDDVPVRFVNEPDQTRSLSMIVVVATTPNGRSDAKLLFI